MPLPQVFSSTQVREHFNDENRKIKTRMVNINADESTCPSSACASIFRAVMVVSDQMEFKVSQDGKMESQLISRFGTASRLWLRGRCHDHFSMLPSTQYVDPITENAGAFRVRGKRRQFNLEKRTKQYLTGESFWSRILESLFDGVGLDKTTHCTIVDLTPYDATLQKYMVFTNHKSGTCGMPTMMGVQPVWYATTDADKDAITRYVQDELKRFMITETQTGTIKYAAIDALARHPPSLQTVPVLDETQFIHSKPDLEAKVCKLKQDFINKWCKVSACKDEFEFIVTHWNTARNMQGDAWKSNKRMSEASDEQAAPYQPNNTDYLTLAEAEVRNGAVVTFPSKKGLFDHVFFHSWVLMVCM